MDTLSRDEILNESEVTSSQSESFGGLDELEEYEEEDISELSDSWPSFADRINDFKVSGQQCSQLIKDSDVRSFKSVMRVRDATVNNPPKSILKRPKKEVNQVEEQLLLNDKRLGKLLSFGQELTSNVRVATDRNEYNRFKKGKEVLKRIKRDKATENLLSKNDHDELIQLWKDMEENDEPVELWHQMQEQKEKIQEIIQSKDNLIQSIQNHLDKLEHQFELDRICQGNYIACFSERINKQIEIMKVAYKHHLQLLENTVEDERQIFAISADEKWHFFINATSKNILDKLEVLNIQNDFFDEVTKNILGQQEEITKNTRIRLQKDIEKLEMELRKAKDSLFMNSEKLDYNYQILRKRNNENLIIINQTKRHVSRMHEKIAKMRRKLRDTITESSRRIGNLTKNINRLHHDISGLEKHSYLMCISNKKKFDSVWDMNYNDLHNDMKTVIQIDRILHEQQFSVPFKDCKQCIRNINLAYKNNNLFKRHSRAVPLSKDLKNVPGSTMRLLRNILRKLSDEGGFLIEERVKQIMEEYENKAKWLVRLDQIFGALRIHNVNDILELTKVFEPFAYCPNCQSKGNESSLGVIYRDSNIHPDMLSLSFFPDLEEALKKSRRKSAIYDHVNIFATKENKDYACRNHYLVMDPTLIRHALTLYTIQRNDEMYNPYLAFRNGMTNFVQMPTSKINTFWKTFRTAFSENKFKLWKRIEFELKIYYQLLHVRQKFDTECVSLRRQNQELKFMFQKFSVQ